MENDCRHISNQNVKKVTFYFTAYLNQSYDSIFKMQPHLHCLKMERETK